MPKDYITILNRLPASITTTFLQKEITGNLTINRYKNGWEVNYIYDDIDSCVHIYKWKYSKTIEEAIDYLLSQLEKQIDIHDLLQP